MFNHKKISLKTAVFIICISLITAFTACGGSSSDTPAAGPSVSGMAVAGAPIIGTVNIKGANGKTSYSAIRADGSYTVDVSALTAPFIIFAEGHVGGEQVRLYSTVDIPGTANVTPATHLAVTLAVGGDPETVYPPTEITTDGTTLTNAAPTTDAVTAAKEKVQDLLAEVFSVLNVPAGFDIMNGSFEVGSSFDKVLDVVAIEVETSGTEAAIVIADKVTGTTYFEATTTDAGADVVATVDNIANLDTAVTQAATDLDKIKATLNAWPNLLKAETEAERRAILEAAFADDYLEDGMNKADTIAEVIREFEEDDEELENIVSITVKNVVISEPIKDFEFSESTYTVPETIYYNSTTIPQGTKFTFASGKVKTSVTANYKAVQVFSTFEFTDKDGNIGSETDVNYMVQKTEGGDWKAWGNRSVVEGDFETRNRRVIYTKSTWDSTTMQNVYEQRDVKYSGYDMWSEDEGNQARTFGTTNFNKEINAILVLTEGLKHSYTDDGKKGILLVNLGIDTQYTKINGANDRDWEAGNNYLLAGRDLDVAQIKKPQIRLIAMNYNSENRTFTPLYTWLSNSAGQIPYSEEALTNSMFAEFTSMPGTDLSLYNTTGYNLTGTQWNVNLAWSAPTTSGLEFNWLYCWFNGKDASNNWLNHGMDLIDGDQAGSPTSSNFTMAYNASSTDEEDVADTKIQTLDSISFEVSYENENGTNFDTQYIIRKRY